MDAKMTENELPDMLDKLGPLEDDAAIMLA